MRHATVVLFLLAWACGCTMPRRSLADPERAPRDQLILVGRLSISRKLPESSNVIDVVDATKSGLIRASAAPLPFLETKPSGFEKNDLLVEWDKLFSVPFEKIPTIFVSGIYAFRFDRRGQETYAFPVMGSIRTGGKGRYHYVGHIFLKLDDFYNLDGVRVADEFAKDAKALARFPGIRKSLFVPN